MHYQRRAATGKYRVRTITQRYARSDDRGLGFAFGVGGKVGYVARVRTFRVLQSMLFAIRIEVRAGRLEVRHITLCILVNVDGVLARREVVQVQRDLDAIRSLGQRRRANVLALTVLYPD